MKDVFDGMDFSEEEAIEADKSTRITSRERDGGICICGHPKRRHTETLGMVDTWTCQPSAMSCPCRKPRYVLEASDVRHFLRKTTGLGAFHALGRGMGSARTAGVEMNWIDEDMICDKCGQSGTLSPVALSTNGVPIEQPSQHNALYCRDCRIGA